jgi:[acyl-carrier-protein] S-malonyltransferase
MKPAQDRLALISNGLHSTNRSPGDYERRRARHDRAARLRDALFRRCRRPVRWLESMQVLMLNRVETVVEVGPGKVLSGLMRQTIAT